MKKVKEPMVKGFSYNTRLFCTRGDGDLFEQEDQLREERISRLKRDMTQEQIEKMEEQERMLGKRISRLKRIEKNIDCILTALFAISTLILSLTTDYFVLPPLMLLYLIFMVLTHIAIDSEMFSPHNDQNLKERLKREWREVLDEVREK